MTLRVFSELFSEASVLKFCDIDEAQRENFKTNHFYSIQTQIASVECYIINEHQPCI
jgi:hypothetical protein